MDSYDILMLCSVLWFYSTKFRSP